MKRIILFSLLAGTLASCAPRYGHPTKSMQEFYADTSTCQATGGQAGGVWDTYGLIAARVHRQCMYGKGWVQER